MKINIKGAFIQSPMVGKEVFKKIDPNFMKFAKEMYPELSGYVPTDGCSIKGRRFESRWVFEAIQSGQAEEIRQHGIGRCRINRSTRCTKTKSAEERK